MVLIMASSHLHHQSASDLQVNQQMMHWNRDESMMRRKCINKSAFLKISSTSPAEVCKFEENNSLCSQSERTFLITDNERKRKKKRAVHLQVTILINFFTDLT